MDVVAAQVMKGNDFVGTTIISSLNWKVKMFQQIIRRLLSGYHFPRLEWKKSVFPVLFERKQSKELKEIFNFNIRLNAL